MVLINFLAFLYFIQFYLILFFFFQVLPRRNNSSWILKMRILATKWPWCQTPCLSPVMWRETQHTATRSSVTAGSLNWTHAFLDASDLVHLKRLIESRCPLQSHAGRSLCGPSQCERCSFPWRSYMQWRVQALLLQLLCESAVNAAQMP